MNNTENVYPVMQSARDRELETIANDIKNQQIDREIAQDNLMNKWGTCDNGTFLSEIIKNLCFESGGLRLFSKSDIFKDYTINQIIDNIAIAANIVPDEWDEPIISQEQLQVDMNEYGETVEIAVRLIKNEMG